MFCNLNIIRPYFSVILKENKDEKRFVFIGEHYNNPILKKISRNETITKSEIKSLSLKLNINENDYLKKYNWHKYNHPIKFIKYKIHIDDTIENLRYKIMIVTQEDKKIIIPNNQQIYLKDGKVLGNFFKINDIPITAIVDNKFSIDKKFITDEGFKRTEIKSDLVNNIHNLVMDEIDIYNAKEYNIYCTPFHSILKLLQKKKIKIDRKVKNGYLYKYYPRYKIDVDIKKWQKIINDKRYILDKNQYIINLINNTKCIPNENCNILQTVFHLETGKEFDLMKFYLFLRRNLDEKLVFIKYKDVHWDEPIISVYKPLVDKNIISQKELSNWIYDKKRIGDIIKLSIPIKGLQIKHYLYTIDGVRKYITISFYDTGTIDVKISFLEEKHANIPELIETINNFSNVINRINKILDVNIPDPKIIYNKKEKRLCLNNIRFNFLNVVTNLSEELTFNEKDFINFIKLFTPYVSPLIDELEIENSVSFKYKRVTNFQNKPEMYKDITILKENGLTDDDIILQLEEKYAIGKDEIEKILKTWKRKYGYYGSIELKINNYGINCDIKTNNGKTKLFIKGSNNIETVTLVNKFVLTLIYIYKNLSKFKDNNFKKYILTDKNINSLFDYEDEDEELEENDDNENNLDTEIVKDNSDNIYNDDLDIDFNNIEIEETNSNDIINKKLEDEVNELITKVDSDGGYKLPEEHVTDEAQISCPNPIPEISTCVDLCNDDSYFLRRLQKFDTKLFAYKLKPGYKRYSKGCQSGRQYKQPVILDYDPDEESKKKGSIVERDSYTYSFRYGSDEKHYFWFICPQVWCPYHQIPIKYDMLKKFSTRATRKGKACEVAICPYGLKEGPRPLPKDLPKDHEVIIRGEGRHKFPGFSANTSPDGFCLPCCMTKRHDNPEKIKKYKRYKKCLGEDIDDELDEKDIYYILSKVSTIPENRFGLLNKTLQNVFDSNCNSGYLDVNTICYVRKGIELNKNQSFLLAVADVISPDKKLKLSLKVLKEHLISKLTPKLFKSLNKGLLELVFDINDKKPIENFKDFIMSETTKIDETFLWDFLSRPGIVEPAGINLIIFHENKLLCPVAEDCKNFYNIDRATFMIFKLEKYYEPIYKLEKYSKEIKEKSRFNSDLEVIKKVINLAQEKCKNKELDWEIILKENKRLYDIQYDCTYKDENTYFDTIKFLKPKKQIIDTYNRMIGVLIDYKKNKNIFIPVRPGSIDIDLDILDRYTLNKYEYTYQILADIEKETGLPVGPRYKVLLYNDISKVVGIITNSGRLLPVERKLNNLVIKKYDLPSRVQTMFLDINEKIITNDMLEDDRLKLIKELEYETETYERIRYELSREKKEVKEKIEKSINEEINLERKRDNLRKILKPIIMSKIKIMIKKPDLKEYKRPNERTLCKTSLGKDPHCINVKGKYKIRVTKVNMVDKENNLEKILTKLTEELCRNTMKRGEILNGTVPNMIDRTKIQPFNDEIILLGSVGSIEKEVSDLYKIESKYNIHKYGSYDYDDPPILERYPELLKVSDKFRTRKDTLSSFWMNKFSVKLSIHYKDYAPSKLYESFAKVANIIKKSSEYSSNDIKDQIIKNISNCKSDIIDYFKTKTIVESFQKVSPLFKSSLSLSDIENIIKDNKYQGSLIDIFIFHKLYDIGTLIVDKRVLQSNPKGYTMIGTYDKYYILYNENIDNIRQYNLIQEEDNVIFDKKILKN